jgi:SNF2 family DNA or RNA helicase
MRNSSSAISKKRGNGSSRAKGKNIKKSSKYDADSFEDSFEEKEILPKNQPVQSFDDDSDEFESDEDQRRPGRPSSKYSSQLSANRFSTDSNESESVELSVDLEEDGDEQNSSMEVDNDLADYLRSNPSLRKSDRSLSKKGQYKHEKHSWDESSQEDEDQQPCFGRLNTSSPVTIKPIIITTKILEKILSRRLKKEESLTSSREFPIADVADLICDKEDHKPAEFEYLVKYKGRSYLHVEWVNQSFIDLAHMGKSRLQRFLSKEAMSIKDFDEEKEHFDPNYIVVDRIIASGAYNQKTYYYVKWCAQQHMESTWECEDDINDDYQIMKYKSRQIRPTEEDLKISAYNSSHKSPSEFEQFTEVPYHDKNGPNQLRSYQLVGLNWLRYSWYNGINSILADEMGLGKTVQSLSIVDYLFRIKKMRGPFLVIVPLSTLAHWQREFERWTDMNALLYHGNAASREIIHAHEWYFQNGKGSYDYNGPLKFNVLITTYEMIISDSEYFKKIAWQYLIIDEAHRLKNKQSRLTTELAKINYKHITLLTGTPIQNNIEELWTLLNILNPKQFNSFLDFSEEFGDLKESSKVEKLQLQLRPYLLRRLKEDVETSIAPKEETIIEVELTQLQKKYYRAILERNFTHLSKGGKSNNVPSLMNIMMQLRKCCNHPFLLKGVEDYELAEKAHHEHMGEIVEASGKLVLIDKLLPKLMKDQHKVLIFSQMVRVLDILQDYLNVRGIKHERIDGGVRGNDRQSAIDRFSAEGSDIYVFLLCTRAGGLGINLTAADTVIIYDSDWNPQNDVQAQARCHRIGQEKKVKIYRLLTRNTYERDMFERASKKLGLDHAVLSQFDSSSEKDTDSAKVKPKGPEIDALLRNGAYGLFKDEDDDASRSFKEADIDKILESNTQTVVHALHDGSSTFSKAVFSSETSRPELDVRDPDFWVKLMPDQSNQPNPDILNEPRFRRVAQKYNENSDSDEDLADLENEEDMDEYTLNDLDQSAKSKYVKPKYPNWNAVGRTKFQKGLLLFGFRRWRMIRKTLDLFKTEVCLELYGRSYMAKLCQDLNIPLADGLKQVHNADINELTEENDALFQTPAITTPSIAKDTIPSIMLAGRAGLPSCFGGLAGATYVPKPLSSSSSLKTSNSSFANPTMTSADPIMIDIEMPTLVPTASTDVVMDDVEEVAMPTTTAATWRAPSELIMNVESATNTPTVSDVVMSDPSLATEAAPTEENFTTNDVKVEAITKEANPVPSVTLDGIPVIDPEDDGYFDNDLSLIDPNFLKKLHRMSKTIFRRLQNLAVLGEFVRSDFSGFNENTSWPVNSAALTPGFEHLDWWKGKHDKDLLIGVYKYGFGRYEHIKNDRSLCFYGNVKLDEKDKLRDSKKKKIFKKGSSFLMKEDPLSPIVKEEDPEKVKAELPQYPPPKWLTQRFKQIIHQLSSASVETRKDKKNRKNKDIRLSAGGRESKLREDWSKRESLDYYRVIATHGVPLNTKGESDFEFIKSKAKLSQKSTDLIQQFHTNLMFELNRLGELKKEGKLEEKLKPFNYTPAQAFKAVERIKLFETLRTQVLNSSDAELSKKIALVSNDRSSRSELPVWWVPVDHDIALMKAFDKHGIFKWDAILADPAFPFRKISQEKQKEIKESKTKPKEEKVEKEKIIKAEGDDEEDDDMYDEDDAKADGAKRKKDTRGKKAKKKATLSSQLELPRDSVFLARINFLISVINDTHDTFTSEDDDYGDNLVDSAGRKRKAGSIQSNVNDFNAKRKKNIEIKRNENGEIQFPLSIGGVLAIESLGTIVPCEMSQNFHNDKYIWPVGFKSVREYISTVDTSVRTKYTCEILNDNYHPIFQITPQDDAKNPILAKSASQAWTKILERINDKRNEKSKRTSVSGPEYFGFGIDIVAELISKMPGAEGCTKFKTSSLKSSDYSKSSLSHSGGSNGRNGGTSRQPQQGYQSQSMYSQQMYSPMYNNQMYQQMYPQMYSQMYMQPTYAKQPTPSTQAHPIKQTQPQMPTPSATQQMQYAQMYPQMYSQMYSQMYPQMYMQPYGQQPQQQKPQTTQYQQPLQPQQLPQQQQSQQSQQPLQLPQHQQSQQPQQLPPQQQQPQQQISIQPPQQQTQQQQQLHQQ